MATEKQLNTRIINKHDSSTNWKQAVNFTPKEGEIIIYDNNKIKIGDGVTKVEQLSFTVPENIAVADTNNGELNQIEKEKLNGHTADEFIIKTNIPDASPSQTQLVGKNAQGQLVVSALDMVEGSAPSEGAFLRFFNNKPTWSIITDRSKVGG